jgi:hypothetical protein
VTWEQFELILRDYGPIVLAFALVLVLLGIIRQSWPLISNFVTVVNALVKLPDLIETVGDIKKEVQPNGGSSMRDVVNRTAEKVESLEKRFDEHLGRRPSQVVQRPTTARKPRARKPAGYDTPDK